MTTRHNTAFKTTQITLWGIVQGVGFRPFTAKLADRMGMQGEVANMGGLVKITVSDTPERIQAFIRALECEKPGPAEIIHIRTEDIPNQEFHRFSIVGSEDGEDETAMIPADLSICPHCLAELHDPANPRFGHPFISCMECGPRYTIIDRLPYDRPNTAMKDFAMCHFCEKEYTDRENRRYHAQTVSCHNCGPMVFYEGIRQEELPAGHIAGDVIALGTELLLSGKVIAVKGVGGYNLVCDPASEEAVKALREVKHREEKPFAVMFQDMEGIRQYCAVSEVEERLLTSSAKPILLLERREDVSVPDEFMKSRFVGAFLPSMGLHQLLLASCDRPLIVTSANLSSMPMIREDEDMRALYREAQGLISGVLYHKREIRVAVDDSVVRVIDGEPQMIRRAKGYAPVPLYMDFGEKRIEKETMLLACGGQLKNSFALSKGPFSYLSQYFGDLDSLENNQLYADNVQRMQRFFHITPSLLVCDLHPLYETTKYAQNYAARQQCKLLKVQHHHAHIASVMAEHGLSGPVIGISFDGTGYGTDGTVWGGEFLLCEGSGFKRAAHLAPVLMIGGDASMKEGWKSAMSYLYDFKSSASQKGAFSEGMSQGDGFWVEEKARKGGIVIDLSEYIQYSKLEEAAEWPLVRSALDNRINTVKSSSMGRLFDAVSALLGIRQENSYEGECAILLEDAAARALKFPGKSRKDDLALQFHEQIAQMVLAQCCEIRQQEKVNQAALSGGVFQNRILMERSLSLLRKAGFETYYNISVSPNDGGIALGQNYIGIHHVWNK